MDAQKPKLPEGCLDESFKGNLRIRLYEFTTNDGEKKCLLDVAAWNSWAGQGKILYALGGIAPDLAKAMFQKFTETLHHYDWAICDFVMEEEAAREH